MSRSITAFFLMTLIMACGSKKTILADQKEIFDISGLPYYKIPDPPSKFTPELTVARMIDGLGFRYYWATSGLRDQDYTYKSAESAQSCEETLNHIYELSIFIHNWIVTDELLHKKEQKDLNNEIKRATTLQNFLESSNKLKSGNAKLKNLNKKMKSGKELSYWFAINGPISDAIWHSGQIVMMRRASGNPIPNGVNVLMGTKS